MKIMSAVVGVLFAVGVLALWGPCCNAAEQADDVRSDEGRLVGTDPKPVDISQMQRHPGFFTFHWDDSTGSLWLELDGFDEEFLYVHSLATGLGSNPVGLDRGQLGETRIVRFKRVADRVFLIQNNLKFRATSENPAEQQAVAESFAPSVLWGGSLKRSTDGQWLVDFTDFFYRDAHDVTGQLAASGQGSFSLDKARSFMHLPRTRAFPDNTEFEVALTFESKSPGKLANRTAADGSQLTLRQHHSFVRLPDAEYRPRRYDPRMGCFSVSYADYSAPIDQPLEQRWITRHRLEKQDPESNSSPPVEPIVYYVDPGVPQPVRDALIEGARWWNDAFNQAGFQDAFQVRLLPPDADPMDVRYNVIQWVHRATRGWSYGSSVVDPRTGEIIKGHVTLGSLRIRQDHLLMQNFLTSSMNPPKDADCGSFILSGASPVEALADGPTSLGVALARIRQLSAHEVGHTLGFSHNFAASTYGDRASVMDYPAPRVRIRDGRFDLSDAYGVGVGEWDKVVVKYAYSEFPAESEQIELDRIVTEAVNRRLLYITDADARPAGAAHPLGNLWDNGSDPVQSLNHEMQVRRLAIEQFGESVLADGQPLAQLGVAFTPIYLHHRYQVEATAKMLGGLEYSYKIKGDTGASVVRVPPERQQAALDALLETVRPEQLVIPVRIQTLIPPRIGDSISDRERLESLAEPAFDPGNAIRTAADLTLRSILQPQRSTRLAQDPDPNWGLRQVLDRMVDSIWLDDADASAPARAARRIVRLVFVDRLIQLAGSDDTSGDVRAIASYRLDQLLDASRATVAAMPPNSVEQAHFEYIVDQIQRFKDRPNPTAVPARPVTEPPGSPIGQRRD